jgi:hypothetical protein
VAIIPIRTLKWYRIKGRGIEKVYKQMNISFVPGDLHLTKMRDGNYVVTLQGEEILRTRIEKKALTKYNELRRDMEAQFPARDPSPEKKAELLQKYIGNVLVSHNGERHQKKRIKSGSTRTFG